MSHDIEDIIAVLDGRPELIDEVRNSQVDLVKELSERFKGLLQKRRFVDSVTGHMPADAASQAHVDFVLKRMEEIATIE